jgi:hypothetical protein
MKYSRHSADRTLPVLLRLRGYLRAGGRYGNSPFLVGQYGGAGELAQGFCRCGGGCRSRFRPSSASHRVCAVFGGTYVLGRKIEDVALGGATDRADAVVRIVIGQDRLTADKLVTASPSPSYTPSHRGIAIIDTPIALDTPAGSAAATEGHETSEPSAKQAESALFVFPPSSFPSQAAALHCLMLGEGAFACPAGQRARISSARGLCSSFARCTLPLHTCSSDLDRRRLAATSAGRPPSSVAQRSRPLRALLHRLARARARLPRRPRRLPSRPSPPSPRAAQPRRAPVVLPR